MNKEISEWFEELPDQCPPEDAMECNGIYFRIANGNPATSEDFFSQRKLQPDKIFKGEGIPYLEIVRPVRARFLGERQKRTMGNRSIQLTGEYLHRP